MPMVLKCSLPVDLERPDVERCLISLLACLHAAGH